MSRTAPLDPKNYPRITRPFGARDLVAAHHIFDISAWVMANGKEVFCMKGQIQKTELPRARDEVFGLRNGGASNSQIVQWALTMYGVDLTTKE